MNKGFYTALGTPLDAEGQLLVGSMRKQTDDQIVNGASGLLVMGSMGNLSSIRDCEYANVARSCMDATAKRCPLFVGVMDTAAGRVKDRIDALKGMNIDGVVATAPYYYLASQDDIISFYRQIADYSPFPVYLYDLPGVVKTAIAPATVKTLMKHDNIKGIKTGVAETAKSIFNDSEYKSDFSLFFSGLDIFDIAYHYGIDRNLDGMFAAMPVVSGAMYKALAQGDLAKGTEYLKTVIALRTAFISVGIWTGFTAGMNLLGYEGNFGPDYVKVPTEKEREIIAACIKEHKIS